MAFNFTRPTHIDFNFDPSRLESVTSILENADRSGFENLGSGDNRMLDFTGTADRKINAQGGDDDISLGSGDDTVYGGSGNDHISTGTGDNTVYAGSGNDYVLGFKGADEIHGGAGDDEIWGDQDASFSNATGNDRLFGDAGNDKLIGHSGADEMTGGTGADTFIYRVFNESTPGMRDHILDFSRPEGDKIDLSFLDANGNQAGNQAFAFVNGSTGAAGQVWAEGSGSEWTVYADLNGGGADMAISVTRTDGLTFAAQDFVL